MLDTLLPTAKNASLEIMFRIFSLSLISQIVRGKMIVAGVECRNKIKNWAWMTREHMPLWGKGFSLRGDREYLTLKWYLLCARCCSKLLTHINSFNPYNEFLK